MGAAGSGPVLWCLGRPDLYGPGLLPPMGSTRRASCWSGRGETTTSCGPSRRGCAAGPGAGLAAVVGEISQLPMVAGRRLQLAAERSGVTALMLRRWRNAAEAAAERDRPSAALTRWRVAALPSCRHCGRAGYRPAALAGRAAARAAAARRACWDVEVADASGLVSLSAGLADRPAAPDRLAAEPRALGSAQRRAG